MNKQTLRQIRKWHWVLLLLGSSTFFVLGWVEVGLPAAMQASFSPLLTTDIEQPRLDIALPVPQGQFVIEQSFVPRWDGLNEISLLVARAPSVETNGRFTLALLDSQNEMVHEANFESGQFEHNQPLTFGFPVQRMSAGSRYTLRISGDNGNAVTFWGYSLDVYDPGQLRLVRPPLSEDDLVPETAVSTLQFTTRNRLTFGDALISLGTMLWRNGTPMLLLLLFVPLPGLLLLFAGPVAWRRWETAVQYAFALAVGLAVWPMLWYFLTLVGGRWRGWSLWLFFMIGYGGVGWLWWRSRRGMTSYAITDDGLRVTDVGLFLLLLAGYAVRLLAVRDVAAPLWVDASRHALITAVMSSTGQTVTDYAPYLPEIVRFPYHFGFHTLSASLQLMTGWGLAPLLLHMGQLLNALVPLTAYAALRLLRQRREAALFGAFLVAFPFFFPAYYTSWGRLTQLTAVLLLPLLVAFSWRLVTRTQPWRRLEWLVVGLLAAGLLLIHFRVFVYYVPLMGVVWLVNKGRNLLPLLWAAGAGLLLGGPRLIHLALISEPVRTVQFSIPNYNVFPLRFAQIGWETPILVAAGVAWLLTAVSGVLGRRWALLPLSLAGWVGLLFILLAGERLGLPETGLVNTNSMYIMVFVPLALFLGVTMGHLWRRLRLGHWLAQIAGYLAAGFLLAALFLFGSRQQITIVNPQTTLVQAADLAALAWIDENVPETAVFANSAWNWLGNTWAGSDGGAWLVPLIRRAATTPPADYNYNRERFFAVQAFNEAAQAIEDWSRPETADFLRENDVTHIYVGVRGGYFRPEQLVHNPELELIYQQNGTFVFALRPQ